MHSQKFYGKKECLQFEINETKHVQINASSLSLFKLKLRSGRTRILKNSCTYRVFDADFDIVDE